MQRAVGDEKGIDNGQAWADAGEIDRIMAELKGNLILIGFMGSGKTTLGKILSGKMQIPFEDTDALIEEQEQRSISEIFRTEGEAYFRNRETELLTKIAESECTSAGKTGTSAEVFTAKSADPDGQGKTGKRNIKKIISVGGGTPVREQNRPLLKKCGVVVYLRIRPETVYERLKGDTTRPLLACDDPLSRIRELLGGREKAYEESADIIIDVDGMGIDEICDDLIKELQHFL